MPGLGALLLCTVAAWAGQGDEDPPAQGHVDVQLAFEQSRGRYGEPTSTRIRVTTLTLRYRAEKWNAGVELPWLDIRDPGGAAMLPGSVGAGGSVERGWGDAWLKLSAELREYDTEQAGIDLTFKLKTRTGSVERGLGTGGTDMALQLEGLKTLGPLTGFGHLGYRRTGDVPGFRPYRNPWYGEAGALLPLAPGFEGGAYWSWREPIGRLGPVRELTLYGAWRGGPQRVQLHLVRGFADASPQYALGLTLRYRF